MKTGRVGAKKHSLGWLEVAGLAGFVALLAAGARGNRAMQAATAPEEAAVPAVAWKAPDPSTIPGGKLGQSIRLGRNIILHTPQYASRYVGDRLTCADCHLKAGTQAWASPLAGLTTVFPAYHKRDGRVITIVQRIQECFERSENGTAPPANSPEMVAMVAYMSWLSKGIPMGSTVKGRGLLKLAPPEHVRAAEGADIYAHQCQVCHGANGQGVAGMFPPLWGRGSFNDGAGMSKVAKMAAFVKANMPATSPGSLSVQQSYDVAAFVTAKPRAHFRPKSSAIHPRGRK